MHFDIDLSEVIEGRGAHPGLVISCIRALPERSLSKALLREDPESEGWDHDRHLLASIFDAIRQNTAATGNYKKVPEFEPWPRPGVESDSEKAEAKRAKEPTTVASLWARMALSN